MFFLKFRCKVGTFRKFLTWRFSFYGQTRDFVPYFRVPYLEFFMYRKLSEYSHLLVVHLLAVLYLACEQTLRIMALRPYLLKHFFSPWFFVSFPKLKLTKNRCAINGSSASSRLNYTWHFTLFSWSLYFQWLFTKFYDIFAPFRFEIWPILKLTSLIFGQGTKLTIFCCVIYLIPNPISCLDVKTIDEN